MFWLFTSIAEVHLEHAVFIILLKAYTLALHASFLRILNCSFSAYALHHWPGEPDWRSKHFICDVYHLHCVLLQMLQRSWVQWQCTHGRETRPTSAVRWRLTPEPQWFGSETASSCLLPTPPTWRSTTHQPSATWRSAAPYWHGT